jgi:hypothetical protein
MTNLYGSVQFQAIELHSTRSLSSKNKKEHPMKKTLLALVIVFAPLFGQAAGAGQSRENFR